ncbi:MAG: hypothetical protein WBL05_13915 [Brooklawnia sp.]|uniref:hypothetical protein n=1 Tax=Brooklawnia sp. TaxID=2699740 RepID=UPI003C72846D
MVTPSGSASRPPNSSPPQGSGCGWSTCTGSAVSGVVATEGGAKVRRIEISDQFGQSATYEQLMEQMGITVDNIIDAAHGLLA